MAGARTVVYLARHGQTALNESGVLRGLLDPPLDETGRRQAALLGEALGWRQLSLVVASPLCRARETAQPVADHAGLAVTVDRCLLDRDYGQWAGTPKDTVTAQWDSVDEAPGVEPRSAVRDRALQGLTALAQRCPAASVVAVSHDAVNREVLAALDPSLGDPEGIPQDNGCFNILQWASGSMAVLSINELPGGRRLRVQGRHVVGILAQDVFPADLLGGGQFGADGELGIQQAFGLSGTGISGLAIGLLPTGGAGRAVGSRRPRCRP